MARRKSKMPLPLALALLVIAAVGYWLGNGQPQKSPSVSASASATAPATEGEALVWYLDVGQGDSGLIQLPDGKNILIDAGTRSTADELVDWLKVKGVARLDAVVATHPHEDHIGGMAAVIKAFDIGKIYAPKVADDQTPTTKTYESLLDAVSEKGLKLTQGNAGMTVLEENGAKLELLAPNSTEYEDLNSYSIAAKLTFGKRTFLFTGDAEADSEKEMVQKGYDLKSDVLKCGHHGSSTSTNQSFLTAVAPQYAVISCGVDNDYGHPHQETLEKLEKAGVQVLRTDRQDTVLARTDGESLSVSTGEKSVIKKAGT